MYKTLLLLIAIIFMQYDASAQTLYGSGKGKSLLEHKLIVKQMHAKTISHTTANIAKQTVPPVPIDGGSQLAQSKSLDKNQNILSITSGVNLTYYLPPGWGNTIVVYNHAIYSPNVIPSSLYDASTISTSDSVFLAISITNNGTDTIKTGFYTYIYVDGVYVVSRYLSSIPNAFYQAWWNIYVGSLSAGIHTFKIIVDATSVIAETNENDNTYQRQYTISQGAPGVPTNVQAKAVSSGQIDLTWNASSGATYYRILRSTTSGTGYSAIDSVQNTSATGYFSVFLNPNTTYYYEVIAGNSNGESSPSSQALATTSGYSPNWSIQRSDTISWQCIKAIDANTVWACGYSALTYGAGKSYIAQTTNGGLTWVNCSSNLPSMKAIIITIEATSATEAWVGDELGNIYYTNNGGASWVSQYSNSNPNAFIDGIKFISTGILVAVADPLSIGGQFLILRTTDNGADWSVVSGAPYSRSDIQEVCYANSLCLVGNTLYAGTWYTPNAPGEMINSTDGGLTWQTLLTQFVQYPASVAFQNTSDGIMTGALGYMEYTVNGGSNWNSISQFVPGSIYTSQSISGTSTYWAGGDNGVFQSTDGGMTWNIQSVPFMNEVVGLTFPSQTTGWVAGSGIIARYTASTSSSPTISSFTPSSGPVGTSVTITGSNFGSTQLSNTVNFGINAAVVTSWSNAQIIATVPNISTGNYSISVTASGQTGYSPLQFTVVPALVLPTLSYPINGTQVTPPALFQWLSSAGATVYDIELGTYVNQVLQSQVYTSNTNSIIIDTLASGTNYSWRVRARSSTSSSLWTPFGTFTTATSQNVKQTAASFPASPTASTDYRLITIPTANQMKVSSFLTGQSKTDFRIFRDNGAASNYLTELSSDDLIGYGEGFWLVKNGDFVINQTLNLPSVINGSVPLTVRTNEWNIIGNPFMASIPWSNIISANSLAAGTTLWTYTGVNGFVSSSSFDPLQGYYYFSNSSTLNIPYPFTSSVTTSVQNVPQLKIGIVYTSSLNKDASTFVGIDARANEGMNQFDLRKPPIFNDQGYVYFNKPEWDNKYSNFASDVRQDFGEGQTWSFLVHHPSKDAGSIFVQGINQIPQGYSAVLVNKGTGVITQLEKINSINFFTNNDNAAFELIIGTSNYVKQETVDLIPAQFELFQNYPNPFNPSTEVRFSLPQDAFVMLKVYDILGRNIATLSSQLLSAGNHQYTFDGRNYSSGIYLYVLQTYEPGTAKKLFSLTKKMILLK